MELLESINSLNRQLRDQFGLETSVNLPMWRVVWSEDQREMRHGTFDDYTASGIYLRTVTEVREVPKYPWIKERYVLENLVFVPESQLPELQGKKLSYEPIWVFSDIHDNYIPPKFEACLFVVYTIQAAKGGKELVKYKEDVTYNNSREGIKNRVEKTMKELFGDDTKVSDALMYGSGVSVPSNYEPN